MIGIIDYGMGNLGSVHNACAFLGLDADVVQTPEHLKDCQAVILPGVGAFGDCMEHLREQGFVPVLQEWLRQDRPFLGICLGLQVLFEESEESPHIEGLGVFPGKVKRFEVGPDRKVPQMGWNRVRQVQRTCPLFEGVPDKSYFYFVHAYYVIPSQLELVAGVTDYGLEYCSVLWKEPIMAVQFHPEKSQKTGLAILQNFATSMLQKGALHPLPPRVPALLSKQNAESRRC